jgi:hypothetical protein
MRNKLALVAITGLAVSAVCIGAAAAIGGRELANGNFVFPIFGSQACERADGASATATTRDLDWDGSDQAVLSVPGQARYTPGIGDTLHLSGDPRTIAHIRLRDGHIEMDCHGWNENWRNIAVTLPGRHFRKFGIAGSGTLTLDGLNQDRLNISIAGSGSVHANGKVEKLSIRIAGSGNADMGNVAADEAEVRIAGSGDADIAPKDEADIRIAGSGDVILHANPARMDTRIAGSGRIRNAGGGI